jgi:hypothetical protein
MQGGISYDASLVTALADRRLAQIDTQMGRLPGGPQPGPPARPAKPKVPPYETGELRGWVETILSLVTEAGRDGLTGHALRSASGVPRPSPSNVAFEDARNLLQREGLVILDRSRWRRTRPEDPAPVPADLLELVATRHWTSLPDMLLECLAAADPAPVTTKALRLLAEAGGWSFSTGAAEMTKLSGRKAIEPGAIPGSWRIAQGGLNPAR